jgi:hypothetical protein
MTNRRRAEHYPTEQVHGPEPTRSGSRGQYLKPEIVFRETLEAIATACPQGGGGKLQTTGGFCNIIQS